MAYRDYESEDLGGPEMKIVTGALVGVLIGALIGAAAMLLFAPQSGKRTRKLLRKRAMALRHQVGETAEEARERAEEVLDEAMERARDAGDEVRERVEHIQRRGQKVLDEQKERVSSMVGSSRNAIRRR